MSLDISRLENVRERGHKTVARCPACAEQGHDQKGEHLVIMPDGRFGCVTCPGAVGKEHRRRIFALAGDPATRKRGAFMVRVRRPASARLPEVAPTVVDLGRLGTGGTAFSGIRATREPDEGTCCPCTDRNGGKASHPSQTVPVLPGSAASDPLLAGAMAHHQQAGQVTPPAQDPLAGVAPSAHVARLKPPATVADLASSGGPPPCRGADPAGSSPREADACRQPDELAAANPIGTSNGLGPLQPLPANTPRDPETGYPIIDGAICPF